MENDARESVLPGILKRTTMLFWVFILPQSVLLALNCFSFWIIREEILPQNLMASSVLFGSEVFLIVFLGALFYSWKRGGRREIPWTWNWFFLLFHIAYLWFATSEIPHIIPGAVESWVLDLGQVILQQYTFMMPGLFYAAMRLACFETRLDRGVDIGRSLLVAVAAPALWYTAMLGLSTCVRWTWGWFPPVVGIIFFVGTTLVTLVALIRLSVFFYGWYQKRDPWIHNTVIALVAVAGPLAGLLLNAHIPFPADFQAPGIYILAILNGLVLLAPSLWGVRGKGWLLFLRALAYPFTVYFFLVFLPFLPLSLLAICALGLGFLFLIPLTLFLIHTKILVEDARMWSARRGRASAAVLLCSACLVLPGYLILEAAWDKSAIQQALDYVYSADYEQPQHFQGSLYTVKKVLVKMKRVKAGARMPYLSAFYNKVVFNGMVLPDDKIEYMYRLFTGEAVPDVQAPAAFFGGRGRLRSSRGGGQGRRIQRNREVILSSFKRFSEDKEFTTVTRLQLYMQNTGGDDAAEFFQECEIPAGVLISDFRLLVNKEVVRGQLFEKETATWVYHMIRDWTRRDPGLLVYVSPTRVEMSVFPFQKNEMRYAELELTYPRGMAPVIKIGQYPIFLKDSPVHNGAMPMALTGGDPGGEDYAFVLTHPAYSSLFFRRKPYLHFILDFSAGSELSADAALPRILEAASVFPEADLVHVSAVNFEVELLSRDYIAVRDKALIRAAIDAARLPRRGSVDLSRAMKRILSLYQAKRAAGVPETWQRYPVFVVISDRADHLLGPDDMAFYQDLVPEQTRYYISTLDQGLKDYPLFLPSAVATEQVVVIKHGPHISWVPVSADPQWRLAASLGQNLKAVYEVYFPGEDMFAPLQSMPLPSQSDYAQDMGLFIRNARMMKNPARLASELTALVRDSKSRRVMIPSTSYIVVERSSQWKTLTKKEGQKMASAPGLEFEEDFDTPAPSMWLVGGLFLLWLCRRQRRPGRFLAPSVR
ncbi:MAG TPA: MSEP-CTERM sorting domain-containing protein [Candidatus Omnitrophota bacterium]|nr:MSEP-CTERM sorting domain-containing protein [Candidatus Omnitrophota bacterium]